MRNHRSGYQSGFIHNLILPSLLLMGVVMAGISHMYGQSRTTQNIAASVDTARVQLEQIRAVLNLCYVVYPTGNNGITPAYRNYPASPMDGSWTSMRDAECPGDPGRTVWLTARETLTTPGMYISGWEYQNTAAGVKVRVSAAAAGDTRGQAVLSQIASRIDSSQKTVTADTVEILIVQ